jgi:hypothetical protein
MGKFLADPRLFVKSHSTWLKSGHQNFPSNFSNAPVPPIRDVDNQRLIRVNLLNECKTCWAFLLASISGLATAMDIDGLVLCLLMRKLNFVKVCQKSLLQCLQIFTSNLPFLHKMDLCECRITKGFFVLNLGIF